ncbi:MAG: histidine phosphatase family protein [Myxococcales bacterium]|nr:histidine phosphatase family protein [Myxococcales bacterium]
MLLWLAVWGAACGGEPAPSVAPAPRGEPAAPAAPAEPAPSGAPSSLCVVRHAEAYKNLSPVPADMSESALDALTPNGEGQARRLVPSLPDGVRFVWSSPAGRTRETAAILGREVEVLTELRQLDGDVAWEERVRAWGEGHDPRPDDRESLADGERRADEVLRRARGALAEGGHGVVVTHGDVASLLLGALRGTPLLQRPTTDVLATGEMACVPIVER